MKYYVLLCLAVAFSGPAWSAVEVSIADHPNWMLLDGPVIVTAKITNTGPGAVLVPVKEGCLESNGYFFEIESGGSSKIHCPRSLSTVGGSIWMKPGDEWWVQGDIQEGLEAPGQYEVRIKIRSSGVCSVVRSLADNIPVDAISSGAISRLYECWSGVTMSAKVSVTMVEPNADDKLALAYAQSLPLQGVPENCLECLLVRSHSHLVERYPSSHYAYLSGYYGEGEGDLEQVMELQPHNVLGPYARAKLMERRLGRKLVDRESATPGEVSSLDLPEGLREYLAWKSGHDAVVGEPEKPGGSEADQRP